MLTHKGGGCIINSSTTQRKNKMTNFKEVKTQANLLIASNAKPSELYAFFRSFDDAKDDCIDVIGFNALCGFTSEYKDAMNSGNDFPEWLA